MPVYIKDPLNRDEKGAAGGNQMAVIMLPPKTGNKNKWQNKQAKQ